MKNRMTLPLYCLALLLVGANGVAGASEVYRYMDSDGVIHYSDKPPSKEAKPVDLPPLQLVSPIVAPERTLSGAKAENDPQRVELSVVSPSPEQTFRGDDRQLRIQVQSERPLPEGYGLLYFLDGSPQNRSATRQMSYVLEGVERGEHLVSVAAVDAKGREVARTPPVIVHMKPPTVRLTQGR